MTLNPLPETPARKKAKTVKRYTDEFFERVVAQGKIQKNRRLPEPLNPISSDNSATKQIGGLNMKKSFEQIAAQLERIYKLYYKGFGTETLLNRAEKCMFGIQNIGLCF